MWILPSVPSHAVLMICFVGGFFFVERNIVLTSREIGSTNNQDKKDSTIWDTTSSHFSRHITNSSGVGPIVYLGLPKTGSTSFHFLMGAFGLPSFHVGGQGFLLDAEFPNATDQRESFKTMIMEHRAACNSTNNSRLFHVGDMRPMYSDAQRILDNNAKCMIKSSGYVGFADDPWPLLFKTIATANPNVRFVIWKRDCKQWAASFVDFFSRGKNKHDWLMMMLGFCALEKTPELLSHLAGMCESHNYHVNEFFSKTPTLKRRLLSVDFMSPTSGFDICEFVTGDTNYCNSIDVSGMPKVQPHGLTNERKMPLGMPKQRRGYIQCLEGCNTMHHYVPEGLQRESSHITNSLKL